MKFTVSFSDHPDDQYFFKSNRDLKRFLALCKRIHPFMAEDKIYSYRNNRSLSRAGKICRDGRSRRDWILI